MYKGKIVLDSNYVEGAKFKELYTEPTSFNVIPFKCEWEIEARFSNKEEFGQADINISKERNLGKGIVSQVKEVEVQKYSAFSKESIQASLKAILSVNPISSRRVVVFTGTEGMFNFNWALRFGEMIEVRNYRTKFKRIKGTYFSLFTKQGKYKLKVQGTTFTVYEATKVIKVFTDVQSVELMNFSVFEKPEIHINKMKVINNYLKKLENGIK